MKKYKVVLADDHQFLIEGILAILNELPYLEICAVAKNGFELMEAVALQQPHLVILDLNMPGYDGMQCLQKIKAGFPATMLLVLTSYTQPELVEEVKKNQADGYLVKNSSAAELKEAVENILAGKKYFPVVATQTALPQDSFFFDDFLKKFSLTKREVDIIRLICGGMSTRQMAAALFLSELTINTHRRNILRKLEIKNVAGLMNFAKQHQLL